MTRTTVRVVALAAVTLVSGCSQQYGQRSRAERENVELRRLLLETRTDLEEVRRDQERLRDSVEYLQYSQGINPSQGDSGTTGTAQGGSWPQDPWSGRDSFPYGASASEPTGDAQAAARPGESVSASPIYNDPRDPSRVPAPTQAAPGESRIVAGVRSGGTWTEPGGTGVETAVPTVPSKLRGTGYDDGVRAFTDQHFDDAIQYFRDFIHNDPKSPYADDAQYWIGECYLRKQLYSNAIKEFNQVVLRYGSGDRSAAALLKLAEVFSKIGDQVDARLSLQKLVNRYPGSSEAAQAYKLLKEMGS